MIKYVFLMMALIFNNGNVFALSKNNPVIQTEAYYDITNSLPKGYVKNASIDYTSIVQRCINEHVNVIFPNFPILINDAGLKLKSNSNYKFQTKSKLILKPSNKNGYNILDCNKKENINIYSPTVVGDKSKHQGTIGEWGFGISIRGAKNINIYQANISDCWGDGIYIGRLDNLISSNILVKDSKVVNSRRNGLSITSGININILNSQFNNSKGKGPSSGIDIEPNSCQDEIKNISLNKIITMNNENWGLLINLVNLRKDNKAVKTLKIDIENFKDIKSKYGLSIWASRKNNFEQNISGNINISNIQLIANKEKPIKYYENYQNQINVNISYATISSSNKEIYQEEVSNYKKGSKFFFKEINFK